MNIDKASKQWGHRPEDERFESIDALSENAKASMNACRNLKAVVSGFRMESVENEGLILRSNTGQATAVSHLACRQLARRIEIPSGIFNSEGEVPKFSARAVANLVNDRLGRIKDDRPVEMYAESTGNPTIPWNTRCVTSDKYSRIHDYYIVEAVHRTFVPLGFRVPPARPAFNNQKGTRPATQEDVLKFGAHPSLKIKVGDPIAPAGLYRGDQDMFIFLVNDKQTIDDGSGRPLVRSTIIRNSEVGEGRFSIMDILHDSVCSNHILWGVSKVVEINYRHVGEAFDRAMKSITNYTVQENSFEEDLKILRWMRQNRVENNREDVVDKIYNMDLGTSITKRLLNNSYDYAENFRGVDADPYTYAGTLQAVTRYSQQMANVGARTQIDHQIGGLAKVAKEALQLA